VLIALNIPDSAKPWSRPIDSQIANTNQTSEPTRKKKRLSPQEIENKKKQREQQKLEAATRKRTFRNLFTEALIQKNWDLITLTLSILNKLQALTPSQIAFACLIMDRTSVGEQFIKDENDKPDGEDTYYMYFADVQANIIPFVAERTKFKNLEEALSKVKSL